LACDRNLRFDVDLCGPPSFSFFSLRTVARPRSPNFHRTSFSLPGSPFLPCFQSFPRLARRHEPSFFFVISVILTRPPCASLPDVDGSDLGGPGVPYPRPRASGLPWWVHNERQYSGAVFISLDRGRSFMALGRLFFYSFGFFLSNDRSWALYRAKVLFRCSCLRTPIPF